VLRDRNDVVSLFLGTLDQSLEKIPDKPSFMETEFHFLPRQRGMYIMAGDDSYTILRFYEKHGRIDAVQNMIYAVSPKVLPGS
jgi:hypothetical protein